MLTQEDLARDHVLVLDDMDPDVLQAMLEDRFPNRFGEIHLATSGKEALEQLDALRGQIRWLFTDKDMPPPNGMVVAEEAVKRGIHTLMLTANPHEVPANVPYTVLAKPFNVKTHLPVIGRFLRPRILHVDDHRPSLEATESMFRRLIKGQKEYLKEENGADAIAIMKAVHRQICCTLSDWDIQTPAQGADIVMHAKKLGIPAIAVLSTHSEDKIRPVLRERGIGDDVAVLMKGQVFELRAFLQRATMLQLPPR